MELHPRHQTRNKAGIELSKSLLNIIQEYDLSYGEIMVIISEIFSDWAHYLRKDEEIKR